MNMSQLLFLACLLFTAHGIFTNYNEDDYISDSSIMIKNETVILYDTSINYELVKT